MRIDPAGWPFVLGGLVLAIIALWLFKPAIGVTLLVLTAFFLFFFRDPERRVAAADTAVLSPADGRVMVAGAIRRLRRFRPIAGSRSASFCRRWTST